MKDVLVHEGPDVDPAAVPCLDGTLWHHGYRSIQDHVRRFNKYTDLEARKEYDRQRPFSLMRLLFRPPAKLVYTLFVRKMITKGIAGFSVAFSGCIMSSLRKSSCTSCTVGRKAREAGLCYRKRETACIRREA